jgi:hypothetical protein
MEVSGQRRSRPAVVVGEQRRPYTAYGGGDGGVFCEASPTSCNEGILGIAQRGKKKKDGRMMQNSWAQIQEGRYLGTNWGPSQPATIKRVAAGPNQPHQKKKRNEADGVDAVQPRRRRPPGHPAGSRRRAGLPPLQEASQVGKRARKRWRRSPLWSPRSALRIFSLDPSMLTEVTARILSTSRYCEASGCLVSEAVGVSFPVSPVSRPVPIVCFVYVCRQSVCCIA